MNCRKTIQIFGVLCFCGLAGGCSFHRLKMDLADIAGLKSVSGTVGGLSKEHKPVIVALLAAGGAEKGISGYNVVHSDGQFFFQRPSGKFYLFAIEDANQDGIYQENERLAVYGNPSVIDLDEDVSYQDLRLDLSPFDELDIPEALREMPRDEVIEQFDWQKKQLGEVTRIDNPDFCPENAELGLWQPLSFYKTHGMKIYFLEPYDSEKIPVLFVHGANGTPANWQQMVEKMDRDRFQPWLLYYPSGVRLDMLGKILSSEIEDLRMRYPFDQLIVVCHSMGGLVGRSALNRLAEQHQGCPLFITFATPWGGHEAAAMGVQYAPAVVPSWRDMTPGSEFLKTLFETPLPAETRHYLFFAYRGHAGVSFHAENTDGTIALKSQLADPVQDAATRVIGIDAGHADILKNDEAITRFNRILKTINPE